MKKEDKKDIELTQEQKDFQAEQRRIIKENLAEWEKNPPTRRHRKWHPFRKYYHLNLYDIEIEKITDEEK